MKNIFLISTQEESNLHLWHDRVKLIPAICEIEFSNIRNTQFIYITDDSEIEVNNWVFNSFNNSIYQIIGSDSKRDILYKPNSMLMCDVEAFPKQYFKIILTNDPSLDGVQQLTEEQLQEYVANPVDSVEVKSVYIRVEGYINSQFSHFSLVFSPKKELKTEKLYTKEDLKEAYSVGIGFCNGAEPATKEEIKYNFKKWFNLFKSHKTN